MPLYEYECKRHGAFELSRPMSESRNDARCPECRRACPRVLSVTNVAQVAASDRMARDRNEQSRHEPRVVSRQKAPSAAPPRLVSASSCGRPWAIGH